MMPPPENRVSSSPVATLNDPALKAELQRLRQTDNITNWYYIARTYLYLVVVLGFAVWGLE
ncbi:MAG: hypothetical protein LC104_05610, partial [Bacteroidales bacterium]|nr:hypothetical protein [Bacteroidales bacterium]